VIVVSISILPPVVLSALPFLDVFSAVVLLFVCRALLLIIFLPALVTVVQRLQTVFSAIIILPVQLASADLP